MTSKQLLHIINQIQNEETRWDGILALKLFDEPNVVQDFISLLQHENWVIRWCIAEKLGDLKHPLAIDPLIERLSSLEVDTHVKKNAFNALKKYPLSIIPDCIPYLNHSESRIRTSILELLFNIGEQGLPSIKIALIKNQDWVISNHLLYAVWKISEGHCEEFLITLMDNPFVQKNAILLLGSIKSEKSIPKLIQHYQQPDLKRLILYAIKFIGQDKVFPDIVHYLSHAQYRPNCISMIKKIGPAILPYLINGFENKDIPTQVIVDLMVSIGPEKALKKLELLAEKNKNLKKVIALINDKSKKIPPLSNFFGIFSV